MQQPRKQKISATVICFNEEQKIERCLKSLAFCDEIVVIDSGSTDNTVALAKALASKVIHQSWLGYVQQKQFSFDSCTHDWALSIDADEVITPELAEEIIGAINNEANQDIVAYELNRVVYFLGKFWRKGGWYPEYRLRLARRSKVRWGGRNPHDKIIVNGQYKRLSGELHHFSYDNFFGQVQSLNNFSSVAANEKVKEGARASIINIILNPCARFIKFYLIRKGYREGLPGFIVALVEAFSVFLKYSKIAELQLYSYDLEKNRRNSKILATSDQRPSAPVDHSRADIA